MTSKKHFLAWLIWGVAAVFYSYEFFVRVSPAVMIPDLMASFKVNAAALGILSGSYYYAYAAMQIPVGALIDRFHIRTLLATSSAIVGLACLIFSHTHLFLVANFARALMGIGSAFAFIGCLKLAANWFSKKRFAIVVGLTNMLGVLGAIFAEAPLASMVNHTGWQATMLLAGITGLVLSLLILIGIRDYPVECHEHHKALKANQLWRGLSHITRCWQTWLVAILGAMMVAPVSSFTELWSVPFLMKAYSIPRTLAAAFASIMFIGIAVGGPSLGYLSGLIQKRKPVIFLGIIGAFIAINAIIYMPLSAHMLVLSLFLFGFFISSMLLCFTINKENNPSWATGVTMGFTNMKVMAAGTIFQPVIGYLLDKSAGLTIDKHNISAFSLTDYHHALSLLSICLLVAFVLIFFVKESYCKQRLQ